VAEARLRNVIHGVGLLLNVIGTICIC